MPNMTILMSNVAAALDKTELSTLDNALLRQYARETQSTYCAGCAAICESAVEEDIPIGDVMRYLMYARSYDNTCRACSRFRKIPAAIRARMATADYSAAEQRCPRKITIGHLMQVAMKELA